MASDTWLLAGSQTVGGFGCCFVRGCVLPTVASFSLQDFWNAIDASDLVNALKGYGRTVVACRVNANGVGEAVVTSVAEVTDLVAATTVK